MTTENAKETIVTYSEDKRLTETPFNVVTRTNEDGNITVATLLGQDAVEVTPCGQDVEAAAKAVEAHIKNVNKRDWKLIFNLTAVVTKLINKEK